MRGCTILVVDRKGVMMGNLKGGAHSQEGVESAPCGLRFIVLGVGFWVRLLSH